MSTKKKETTALPNKDYRTSETNEYKNTYETLKSQKPSDFSYNPYQQSDTAKGLWDTYLNTWNNRPGQLSYDRMPQYDDVMNKILNREDFTYDLNGDALYQQYKDQYTLKGLQGMMDTMGQAQAMTGGYGNSYAQSVGQQTYQGYLQQLNDKIPELYQLALDTYNQEGQNLYDQFSMLYSDYQQKFEEHRADVSDWYKDVGLASDAFWEQTKFDYGNWYDTTNLNKDIWGITTDNWYKDVGIAGDDFWKSDSQDYTASQDDIENKQWEQEFSHRVDQDNVANNQWQKEYESTSQSKASENLISLITSTGYEPTDAELKAAGMTREQANAYKTYYTKQNANTSSSSNNSSKQQNTGDKTGDGNTYTAKPSGWDKAKIEAFQEAHDLTVDGIWGPKTAAAYDKDSNWEPEPEKPTYDSVVSDLNTYIKNGASKSEINNYLRAEYKAGTITQSQYNKLKEQYAPRGSTY